jgi:hypothetical protein
MAERRGIGNVIAPWRFLLFVALLIAGSLLGARILHARTLGFMAGFDVAAVLFLASCLSLLGTRGTA